MYNIVFRESCSPKLVVVQVRLFFKERWLLDNVLFRIITIEMKTMTVIMTQGMAMADGDDGDDDGGDDVDADDEDTYKDAACMEGGDFNPVEQ